MKLKNSIKDGNKLGIRMPILFDTIQFVGMKFYLVCIAVA